MQVKEKLKIFYLRKRIVFPFCNMNVTLKDTDASSGLAAGEKLVAFPIRNIIDIIFHKGKIATLSEVTEVEKEGDNVRIMLKGISRVKIEKIDRFQTAYFSIYEEEMEGFTEQLKEDLRKKTQELIFLINVKESDRLISLLNYLVEINQMTDFISNYFVVDFKNRSRLFNEMNIGKRTRILISIINRLIENLLKKKGDVNIEKGSKE